MNLSLFADSAALFTDIATLLPLLIGAGFAAGFVAGLFGIGGGLVFVPASYFVLQSIHIDKSLAMTMAVSTSLVSIIPTAISSSFSHYRLGQINWCVAKKWAPALLCGVSIGALLVTTIDGRKLILFFSLFLLVIAVTTWFKKENGSSYRGSIPGFQYIVIFTVGLFSSMAGVGGGALSVPTLRWFGLTIHKAIGTGAVLGVFISVSGALSILVFTPITSSAEHGPITYIFLPALLVMAPCAIIFAPIGAKLGHRCSAQLLSRLFSVCLFLMGIKILSTYF